MHSIGALLERMYAQSIWDRHGKQWLPLFGYDDEVIAFAPAREALSIFTMTHFVQGSSDGLL